MRPELAAVLWDMDGTLVDTEPYWMAAEYELVEEFGGIWGPQHAHAIVGRPLLYSAEYLREHGRVLLEPEAIVDRLLDSVIEQVRRHVPWRPGAHRLLAELRAEQVPCALVTMSYLNFAEAVVGSLPPGSFTELITGDAVVQGKPHPEPYLRAVDRLGVDPSACLAIEDSVPGVASAEAAGVPVLAVEHLVSLPPGPARRVIGSLDGVTAADLVGIHRSLVRA